MTFFFENFELHNHQRLERLNIRGIFRMSRSLFEARVWMFESKNKNIPNTNNIVNTNAI